MQLVGLGGKCSNRRAEEERGEVDEVDKAVDPCRSIRPHPPTTASGDWAGRVFCRHVQR